MSDGAEIDRGGKSIFRIEPHPSAPGPIAQEGGAIPWRHENLP
jgi:hypothetical protein